VKSKEKAVRYLESAELGVLIGIRSKVTAVSSYCNVSGKGAALKGLKNKTYYRYV